MVLCDICEKRTALVFVSKKDREGSAQTNYCLICARKAEIPQVAEYMKKMNITDEDIQQIYSAEGNDKKSGNGKAGSLSEAIGHLFRKQPKAEHVRRVNMVLCKTCRKRPSVVFVTSACGSEEQRCGLCLSCAKQEQIPQIAEYIGYMGITDEDIERMYGAVLRDENSKLGDVSNMPVSIRSMFVEHI